MTQLPTVFIHTNDSQLLGAVVAAYSFRKYSRNPTAFDVRLLRLEETPQLLSRQGQTYLRKGRPAIWHNEDLQSFSPLRRMVPQVMGFRNHALVTDPDVFSVGGDVYDLLSRDMGDAAVVCRTLPDGAGPHQRATSVMLLDCAKLTNWQWDAQIDQMFASELDYKPWIQLEDQPLETIDELPEVWNSYDTLTDDTCLLHMTERSTQPWKTGLPVDYNMNSARKARSLKTRLRRWGVLPSKLYLKNPDQHQIDRFFGLMKECLEQGEMTEAFIAQEIARKNLRPDVIEQLERVGYERSANRQLRSDALLRAVQAGV